MKKKPIKSIEIDDKLLFLKEPNIKCYCKACDVFFEREEVDVKDHALLHEEALSFCTSCNKFVKNSKLEKHMKKNGCAESSFQNTNFSKLLFEYRLVINEKVSLFYGVNTTNHISKQFYKIMRERYKKDGNFDNYFVFRDVKSKFLWNCILCHNPKLVNSFTNSISLRCYALNHLMKSHAVEAEECKNLIEDEWNLLHAETNFNLETVMKLARTRSTIEKMSRSKFYTVDLSTFKNGANFEDELVSRGSSEPSAKYRFCLICCSLVSSSSEKISQHFALISHLDLNSHSDSSTFFQEETPDPDKLVDNNSIEEFVFPTNMFAYQTAFKTNKNDVFKWRCSLCEDMRTQTFVTYILLRMYALRHIDKRHIHLFNDNFVNYEWNLIKSEMHADFDIRRYTPKVYTIRGEGTFNPDDPNDYVLPQQYHFLPIVFVRNHLICGFCYRSLKMIEFIRHIEWHGFEKSSSKVKNIKEARSNEQVDELMGRSRFKIVKPEDPPLNFLTREGEKLRMKVDDITERCKSSASSISGFSTPSTPSRRKSALNAKSLLARTVRMLQDRSCETDCSLSSSSNSSNSSDDATFQIRKNRKKRRKIRERSTTPVPRKDRIEVEEWTPTKSGVVELNSPVVKMPHSVNKRKRRSTTPSSTKSFKFDKMTTKDIKELLQSKAAERGVSLAPSCSSSDNDENTTVMEKNVEITPKIEKTSPVLKKTPLKRKRVRRSTTPSAPSSKFGKMTPRDIKNLLKLKANDRGISFPQSDSSSSSSSDEESKPVRDGKLAISAMRPSEIRKWIKLEAKNRGVQWNDDSSSSSSSDD